MSGNEAKAAATAEEPPRIGAAPRWAATALLVIAVAVVFGRVAQHSFLSWQDDVLIADNPYLDPPTAEGLSALWSAPYGGMYAPLALSMWAGAATLGEGTTIDPLWFHLTNVVLHAACSLLVFVILARLVAHAGAACCGALLFAVHPLQVESVAWIAAGRGVLAAFFGLTALWLYVRLAMTEPDNETEDGDVTAKSGEPDESAADGADEKGQRDDREADPENEAEEDEEEFDLPPVPLGRYVQYVAATVALILGLLASPMVAAVPLLALAIDFGWLRRSPRERPAVWSDWSLLIVWVIIAAGIGYAINSLAAGQGDPRGHIIWGRPLIAADAMAYYLYKLVVPIGMSVDYGRTPTTVLTNWWGYVTWFVPAFLVAVLVQLRERRPWLTAAAVFAAALLPTLGLLPFAAQHISTVADRYAYMAMFAPALALAYVAAKWWSRQLVAVLVACLAVFAGLSYVQAGRWQDNDVLWSHVLSVNESSILAHTQQARGLLASGDLKAARAECEAALRVAPKDVTALVTLGELLLAQDNVTGAIARLREAVREDNTDTRALIALARADRAAESYDEATTLLERALSRDRHLDEAYLELGFVKLEQENFSEAIENFEQARRIRPRGARAYYGLARTLLDQLAAQREALDRAQLDLAITHLETAREFVPEDDDVRQALVDARRLLAGWLAAEQRLVAAEEQLRQVQELVPELLDVRVELAAVLQLQGQYKEAEEVLREIIADQPDAAMAHFQLGVLLAEAQRAEEAVTAFEQSLELEPERLQVHYQIGLTWQIAGERAMAVAAYRRSLADDPTWEGWQSAANNLAWILATDQDEALRDGQEAVDWAERVTESFSEDKRPQEYLEYLDTLAAAYAEAERFNDAVATARIAMELAEAIQREDLAERFRSRLELFLTSRPVREPAPTESGDGPGDGAATTAS